MKGNLARYYQALRQEARKDVRDHVLHWAENHAPGDMTISQLKALSDGVTQNLNYHMRQVFDMMRPHVTDEKEPNE